MKFEKDKGNVKEKGDCLLNFILCCCETLDSEFCFYNNE